MEGKSLDDKLYTIIYKYLSRQQKETILRDGGVYLEE